MEKQNFEPDGTRLQLDSGCHITKKKHREVCYSLTLDQVYVTFKVKLRQFKNSLEAKGIAVLFDVLREFTAAALLDLVSFGSLW